MSSAIDPKKLVRWYDFQAPFYRLWRNDYRSPLPARVAADLRALDRRERILDAGCGTGWFTIALARALAGSSIDGVDLSAGMLAVAAGQARRFALPNVRLWRADVLTLPFRGGSFDAVLAAGLLPNLNDVPGALRELARVLRPGGRLLLVEFDREAMGPARRLIFRAMILGYRAVSTVLPRYRFAASWDIRSSTIERRELERTLAAAGLEVLAVASGEGHLVFHVGKGPGA